MKIAVVGSRKISDVNMRFISEVLDRNITKEDMIISGGARGVDAYAEWYAMSRDIKIQVFHPKLPNTIEYKKRNQLIAVECDKCLAFPSVQSKGTWDTINKCKKVGKNVFIFILE